ncbi:MAG: PstS family phosphate ABC transporter substrate-binding protein [Burkholderiales bacterium]
MGYRTFLCVPVIAFMMSMAQAQPVRIAGSGATVGAVELLVAEFRKLAPAANFARVDAIGSTGAIKAVASGALHIGLTSRSLSEAEKSLDVAEVEYARTPFVLVVRADSKIVALSDDQLAQFMSGTVESGPDQVRVRPVLRPANDVDTVLLRRMAPKAGAVADLALKRPGMMVATNDREAADMVERTVGAIGANALGLILSESRRLRAVSLDGMQPSLSAFETGKYPHHKRLFLVTPVKQPMPAEARRFIEFLSSPAAKAILRRTGHTVPPF